MARFVGVTSQILNRIFSANAAFPSAAFAGLPAAGVAGRVYRVTDAGTTGSIWMDTGTRWKPLNNQCVLATLDTASSNIGNSETVVFQYLIPAGVLQTNDRMRIVYTMTKSGTTDTGNLKFRVGTAGTTADTQLVSYSILSAANQAAALITDFRLQSATSLMQLGESNGNNATSGYSSAATGAPAAAVTITSAAANALYFSVTINSSSTNNTVSLTDAQLSLIASAN